jgi:3-deoxy-manno-octulosonate cytidylyltransferase (CMP-KDO synthetase)
MNAVVVIPARFASTRFPGKPLALIAGVSLIERVYRRAAGARRASSVWVATDDQRIFEHVIAFDGRAVMTPPELASGTDRIAFALDRIEREGAPADQVVNVQGDEPLIDPEGIDAMIEALQSSPETDIVTLVTPLVSGDDFLNPDVVKVVAGNDGFALYFSRAPIPAGGASIARRHVGIYGYQAAALRRFASLSSSPLETAERLEQLRALQNGLRIRLLETAAPHLGVDRPEDVERIERELAKSR